MQVPETAEHACKRPMIDHGISAFLQQAHRNNWQQYLASLKSAAPLGWDVCVLTASDERQASMYRRQLDRRRECGLLPPRTRFMVIADPDGRRIGSGGATLRALSRIGAPRSPSESVLIIHSGGDSRRLPHCSASGKLFARVPRELPDGRASTVFDEFLISLSGLAAGLPPGVLVASGDVLLIFDHLQVSLQRPGVTGVAAAAPAAMGMHHGVYATGKESKRLRAYLHKASLADLESWEAVDASGQVQIDTGLAWLDDSTVRKMAGLASEEAVAHLCGISGSPASSAGLNLYGDLLLPLADSTTLDAYLNDTSDGPATPEVQEARRVIWNRLRGTPFTVEQLQPAFFVHVGTSREYWEIMAGDADMRRACGWTEQAASWHGSQAEGLVLSNALLQQQAPAQKNPILSEKPGFSVPDEIEPALITDSCLEGIFSWEGAAIVAGVQSTRPLVLGKDVVVHQLPVSPRDQSPDAGAYVTRVFGLSDDAKRPYADPSASYMNRPWRAWFEKSGIGEELLWSEVPPAERSLWNARLFPISPDREESLALSLSLFDPAIAPAGWRPRWQSLPRLSLAGSFLEADSERVLAELAVVEDRVAARRFLAGTQAEQPASEIKGLLGASIDLARRGEKVASSLAESDPVLQLRGYKALAEATGDGRWEDVAFAVLASTIERAMPPIPHGGRRVVSDRAGPRSQPTESSRSRVRVEAPARIDLGGGWTDTPPYSIERGGTVLNAAIMLRGTFPIAAQAERLAEPRLILHSRDIDASLEPSRAGEILAYANPADPFALHKAALVLRGVVTEDVDPSIPVADLMRDLGGGIRLSTQTSIPRGSGLGTSSIIAGAVLVCLSKLNSGMGIPDRVARIDEERVGKQAGFPDARARLFDEVLCLEQMLTTGGGWQDQVGGLTGGIKLITTEPGLPQRIRAAPVKLAAKTEADLAERLILVYTGQQRLAKNLLRSVMGRWMARDPEMVWILKEIARLATAMRESLEGGDLDSFGELLAEHWALNKRMDPGCSNSFIDTLFEVIGPCIDGAKLAGAGGGGFVIALAHSRDAVEQIRLTLDRRFHGTPVAIWPCSIPAGGVI